MKRQAVVIKSFLCLLMTLIYSAQQIQNVGQPSQAQPSLVIVYNCFLNVQNPHWLKLIQEQVSHIKRIGVTEYATTIYATISVEDPSSDKGRIQPLKNTVFIAVDAIRDIIPNVKIELTLENKWEYPGIRKVWDISRQFVSKGNGADTIVLYFHSKGMGGVDNGADNVRSLWEVRLFKSVIVPWKDVLRIFEKHINVNKVGYAASETGYLHHNFFWARASYLSSLEMPLPCKDDRSYFERWLSRVCVAAGHELSLHPAESASGGASATAAAIAPSPSSSSSSSFSSSTSTDLKTVTADEMLQELSSRGFSVEVKGQPVPVRERSVLLADAAGANSIIPLVDKITASNHTCESSSLFQCSILPGTAADTVSLCLPDLPIGQTYTVENIPLPPLDSFTETLATSLLQ